MLATIRKNTFINTVGRITLKKLNEITKGLFSNVIRRWPLSGVIPLNFGDLKFKMYSECDDFIVNTLYYHQQYREYDDTKLFLELVKQSKVVFDIGANTGIYSILGSKELTDAASNQIFCFEPYSPNLKRLKKNILLNKLQNVEIVDYALGNSTDILNFTVPNDDRISDVSSADGKFSRSMYDNSIQWKEIKVKQTTIDLFVEERRINSVDLMKIDVENYEMQVFQGAINTLKKLKPVIICEIFLDAERKQFFDNLLADCGYYSYLFENNTLKLLENGLESLTQGLNYVFAPFKGSGNITFPEFARMAQKVKQQ